MSTHPRWPVDFFFEISEEAASKTLADQTLDLDDIKPARRYPPSCKKNGVLVKDHTGKIILAGDLYYDDFTGKWLLALPNEQYRKMKQRTHGPHDTLGALVI